MGSSDNGWHSFWKSQSQAFNQAMKISTTFFARRIEKEFKLNATHKILDYGAGPGFLSDYFESKYIIITSTDINGAYVNQHKSKSHAPFIQITTDTLANKEILDSKLTGEKFDFIILLSVIQYFKSLEETEDVVKMLQSYLEVNGKLIVADVITNDTSAINDAKSLLLQCVKEGKIITFVRFIMYVVFSDYRKHRIGLKLLTLSDQDMKGIANRSLLSVEKMDGLTIHSGRTNYIFTKQIG